MLRVLVPVDGSSSSLHAVRRVINEFRENSALEIHLLNVQRPLSTYASRFISRIDRDDFHRDQAKLALLPAKEMLDRFEVPYSSHFGIGEKASVIVETANQIHCDHILMGTARKNSLIRMVENSTTNEVIELATVPVKVVSGDPVSPVVRYGIPAGVGTGLASLFFAAAE